AVQRRYEEAGPLIEEAERLFEDRGFVLMQAVSSMVSGPVYALGGDLESAERRMQSGVQTLADIGEYGFLSTLAAELGEILYLRGKDDEALEMTKRSEEAAASDDMATQVQWRRVRSKILARRGEL